MNQPAKLFGYDIFLCFSSRNEAEAKILWQELSSCGLKVFWSDVTLKQNVGESFFAVIEKALMSSRHFVLLWTKETIQSKWVKLEYESFFSHYHLLSPQTRRFIIFQGKNFHSAEIPLFLKNIQCTQSINEIISIAGGIDIHALQNEIKSLKEQLFLSNSKINELHTQNEDIIKKNEEIEKENVALKEQLFQTNDKVKDIQKAKIDITKKNKILQEKIKQTRNNIVTIENLQKDNNELKERLSQSNNKIFELQTKNEDTTQIDKETNPFKKTLNSSNSKQLKLLNNEKINTNENILSRALDRLWSSNNFVILILWCFHIVLGFIVSATIGFIFIGVPEGKYFYSFLSGIISLILIKFFLISNKSHTKYRLKKESISCVKPK